MICNCGSSRIAHLQAKHDDRFALDIPHLEIQHRGYAPYWNENGERVFGGDYTNFSFCLDCGLIQNFVPILDEEICEEL